MPRKFVKYLQPYNIYTCKYCNTHIACLADIVTKSSSSFDNSTYFFYNTYPSFNLSINTKQQKPSVHQLLSGQTIVADLFCNVCHGGSDGEPLGWKYVKVSDPKMKFKEGLAIVEKKSVKKSQWIKKTGNMQGN